MTCYHPITAWRVKDGRSDNGSWPITFDRDKGLVDMPVQIPCGRCIGCRLERSRQWAVRLMHEASLHDENCFLTLTYSPEHLPSDGSLHKEHFQLFMKRLRKHLHGERIRFFHCGEYGETNQRPHYHALIFGYDPPDKIFYKNTGGNNLWLSPTLDRLWRLGFVVCGSVSFDSAAYCARYIMKKQFGSTSARHYVGPETVQTGELRQREYTTMSRRPGIAHDWIEHYGKIDVYPRDAVLSNGFEAKPPRYYDQFVEKVDPQLYAAVLSDRRRKASHLDQYHQTPDRLAVREKVKTASVSSLSRPV